MRQFMTNPDQEFFHLEEQLVQPWVAQLRILEQTTNQSQFFDAINHYDVLQNVDKPAFQTSLRESLRRLLETDFNANRFRVATLLALMKGSLVQPELREALGLNSEAPDPNIVNPKEPLPTLFVPAAPESYWYNLCADAEFFLERTLIRHKPEYPLHYFQQGMVGKSEGIVAGLCYQTTEFPNGAIFIEGVWYTLRHTETAQRVLRLNELREAEQKGFKARALGLKMQELFSKAGTEYVMDGPDVVRWTRFPSTWQPSTGFAPAQNISTDFYSSEELHRFLKGEVTTEQLYESHGAKTPIFKNPDVDSGNT